MPDADLPPEAFLAGFPDGIRSAAETLRAIVRRAVPDSIESVRGGWRLIGYEVPVGRRTRYFAYVAPEPIHVHLGFEYGAWMEDPDGCCRAPTSASGRCGSRPSRKASRSRKRRSSA